MDEEVEVARLELVKYVTSDNVVVKLRLSEDMSYYDAMAMIMIGVHTLFETFSGLGPEDGD
jgi:hypothetical protein